MPVPILFNYLPKIYSGQYYVQIAVALLALAVVRAYAQGRNTSRERDLHARVILLTVSQVLLSTANSKISKSRG